MDDWAGGRLHSILIFLFFIFRPCLLGGGVGLGGLLSISISISAIMRTYVDMWIWDPLSVVLISLDGYL